MFNFKKDKGITVIGVSGKKGAGKDMFFNHVKAMAPNAKRVAFADYLKHITRQQFGLSIDQTDGNLKEKSTKYVKVNPSPFSKDIPLVYWTPREIMIDLGQFYRSIDPLFWVNKAFQVIKSYPQRTIAVITDVRFENEADLIKGYGGTMVRLQRSNKMREGVYPGCSNDTDISETSLDNYEKFDFIVPENRNENPQQLMQETEKIFQKII